MKYAVFKTGGKQYRVYEGQILKIEKIDKKPKEKVEFGEVLLLVNDNERQLGKPFVEGALVEGEVMEQIRGPKIYVSKFKAKVNYRKKSGHRQALTRVKISKIGINSGKESKEEPKVIRKAKSAAKKIKQE